MECPECGGRVETKRGEIVCSNCGLVIEESMIDPKAEYYAFQEERKRAEKPVKYPGRTPYKIRRIIEQIVTQNRMPMYIADQATEIALRNRTLIKGRTTRDVALASVYIAAKKNGLPFRFRFPNQRDVWLIIKTIVKKQSERITPTSPHAYVEKVVEELGLPYKVSEKAKEIIRGLSEKGIPGIAPTVAGAAVLLTMPELRKTEVAKALNVTPAAIRQMLRKIRTKSSQEHQAKTATSTTLHLRRTSPQY
jgi:transcription initiation factor TFIIB